MVQATIQDNGIVYDRHAFYQYDYGQTLEIFGTGLAGEAEVHFARKGMAATVKTSIVTDGKITVTVPNTLLKNDGELTVYICKEGKTYHGFAFIIKPREIPENYNPPEEEESLMSRLSTYSDESLLKELGMI